MSKIIVDTIESTGTTVTVNDGLASGAINAGTNAITAGSVTGLTATSITSGTLADGIFASDSILFIKEAVVAADSTINADPGASFTDATGCTITVAAADANRCSKLVVIMVSSFRVDRSSATYTFADSRIARSAPSSANSGNVVFGIAEANNNPEIYDSVKNVYVDESLSNADHTYILQYRNGTGNAITAGTTYPRYGEFYVMVVGVK